MTKHTVMRPICGVGLMVLLLLAGCMPCRKPLGGPSLIPGTDRHMLTAGYWITRHPSPDALIRTPEQIADLNRHIEKDLKTVTDIPRVRLPDSGLELAAEMRREIQRLQARPRYLPSGHAASDAFYQNMADYMDVAAIPETLRPGYGIAVRFSDQRLLPTLEPLYGEASDTDFDSLQNNTLELGTPLLLLYRTRDLNWTYVRSPYSSGWVESRNIAGCALDEAKDFAHPERFVVILRSKADIYRNPALTVSEEFVQMGTRLPLVEAGDKAYQVRIPVRDSRGDIVLREGYILKTAAREGYLPYTARNTLQQAFEMLNAPYGWGGMYGEQDCSRFIQQVFATVGIQLPRNSADQAKAGKPVAEFDPNTSDDIKIRRLDRAAGGITTLYMKGHIMLYLGKAGSTPYAIHETWAYRVPDGDRDLIYKINRVTVTDLDLGAGTRGGSLLSRLKSVQEIR